jgi:hypothetical protein
MALSYIQSSRLRMSTVPGIRCFLDGSPMGPASSSGVEQRLRGGSLLLFEEETDKQIAVSFPLETGMRDSK